MTTIFDLIEQIEDSKPSNPSLEEVLKKRVKDNKRTRTVNTQAKNTLNNVETRSEKKQITNYNLQDVFQYLNNFKSNLDSSNNEITSTEPNKAEIIKVECINVKSSNKKFDSNLEYQYDIGQDFKFDSKVKIGTKESKYITKVMTKGYGIIDKEKWLKLIQEEAEKLNEIFIIDELERYYKNSSDARYNSNKEVYFIQALEGYSMRIWENKEWAGYDEFNKILRQDCIFLNLNN